MTDRRRNVFILLFVLVLVLASVAVLVTKPTKLGLDLRGGVQLTYKVSPLKGQALTDDSVQRTIDVMSDRVNTYGVAEAEIQRSGQDQIDVSLPDLDDPAAAERVVGTTAQLAFYDWEANVLGPSGQPAPTDSSVTGTGTQGTVGGGRAGTTYSHYDAVIRASKYKAKDFPTSVEGQQWYLVNDKTKRVEAGPEGTKRDLRQSPAARKQISRNPLSATHRLLDVPPGYRIVQASDGDGPEGKAIPAGDHYYILFDRPALKGTDIRNPTETTDPQQGNAPAVSFSFTSKGEKIWSRVTKQIAQRGQQNCIPQQGLTQDQQAQVCSNHFAIVLDQQLISVPTINFRENPNGIGGSGGSQITGNFTIKSAQRLADLLKSGSLPLKVTPIAQQQVSATLGQEALDQGLIAGAAGFLVVALFLLAFYRVLGLVAVVGLAVYTIFFLALVKTIPIVLSLPGIAGLILTIAVAADANVVIFERVKDELADGRSVTRALKDGYRKGLSAIIDGNVITFLVAFILFLIATSGVKGFALNLGVGVLVSMVTAIVLTQAILGVAGRSRLISHPAALGARTRKPIWHRFDFVGKSRYFFAASGVILAIGAFGIGVRGLNLGIDFESGTRITATARAGTSVDDIRGAMRAAGRGDAKIQSVKTAGGSAAQRKGTSFQIATEALSGKQLQQVTNQLQQRVGVNPQSGLSNQTVGPTFGQTVARLAVIAVLASFVMIAFVIWFRFGLRYTAPILIAVIHDMLIVAGVYALTGAEISASTVAALLTIIGYSLYDTIIVFDRVRENLRRLPSAAFSQIVNRSMSEVLGRSLVTSFSTGLPVLALLLFGGDTLKDFALAMLVGTISGAYSSVFIASPVLAEWMERAPNFRARRRRLAAAAGGHLPAYPTAKAKESERRPRPDPPVQSDAPGQEVSGSDFREMVSELGLEDEPDLAADSGAEPAPSPAERLTRGRRGGAADGSAGRRKKQRQKKPRQKKQRPAPESPGAGPPPAKEGPETAADAEAGRVERARDLDPDEVILEDEGVTGSGSRGRRRGGRR